MIICKEKGSLKERESMITKEQWDLFKQYKQRFLHNGGCDNTNDLNDIEDLSHLTSFELDSGKLHPALISSWQRCRNLKIDPYNPSNMKNMEVKRYKSILDENNLLLEIAREKFKLYKSLILYSNYYLEIINNNDISLLKNGNLKLPLFASQGYTFGEHTMGTNAHTLSRVLKRPVQLFGPEHYCVALENIIASAAPILDNLNEIVASVILLQPIDCPPWERKMQDMLQYSLGLVICLAKDIQTQLLFQKTAKTLLDVQISLTTCRNILKSALDSVDGNVLVIDQTGLIIDFNAETARLFNLQANEEKNITEYLDLNSNVIFLAAKGQNVFTKETFYLHNKIKTYEVELLPLKDYSAQKQGLTILKFSEIEKTTSPAKNSGTQTKFHFSDIIGESKAMKRAVEIGQLFAESSENILLIGESGTGKELFAQAIHNRHCPTKPFIAINCAALPRELIASELFGYEGGSFTGAEKSGRAGKIELAKDGTLFLDEIGDMPLDLQTVLLRVLEDNQVVRLGGRSYKKIKFRTIAATNKDLYKMVKEQRFREDLYFRLSVLPITLPPLRQRENDINILSSWLIQNYCQKSGRKILKISPEVQKVISEYDWPGNVRQLKNVIIYALNIAKGDFIELRDLPDYIILSNQSLSFIAKENLNNVQEALSLKRLEKAAIDLAMAYSQNSIAEAANLLEISKATLYRKLREDI